MPTCSQNKPVIATRSDDMGVATVNKLAPTRALLLDRHKNWILVTPKESFNDPTLDLTEKLSLHSKVAFKSNRLTGNKTYNSIAVFVRPITECILGEAIMTEIKPTYAYAKSNKYGSIFFPVSAIIDSIINEAFMRRHHDLSKCLRLGDPIWFVAVTDDSTRNRSACAVEVQCDFNKVEGKPMTGIITKVTHSTCTVWAKNFPILPLEHIDFKVDLTVDLRKVFNEGDRVTFRATQIGCGIGGISAVVPIDQVPFSKLEWARANMKGSGNESTASGSMSNEGDATENTAGSDELPPSNGAIKNAIEPMFAAPNRSSTVVSARDSLDEDLNFDIKDLEEELDCMTESSNENKGSNFVQAQHLGATAPTGDKFRGQSFGIPDTNGIISRKHYVDAEVQTSGMIETEAIKILLQDMEIFSLACQRFPALMRDIVQCRRGI